MRRIVLAVIVATACGSDDDAPTGSTGASSGESTCGDGRCDGSSSTSVTTSAGTTAGSSESSTTSTPGDTSTTNAESSTTDGPIQCGTATCSACFSCTYDDACAEEQSQCSVDPACSIALICVRDCIEQSPEDAAACVSACECPSDGAFQALFGCVVAICVPNGSCPAVAC